MKSIHDSFRAQVIARTQLSVIFKVWYPACVKCWVFTSTGSKHHKKTTETEVEKRKEEKNVPMGTAGGVHNPSNRLPAGEWQRTWLVCLITDAHLSHMWKHSRSLCADRERRIAQARFNIVMCPDTSSEGVFEVPFKKKNNNKSGHKIRYSVIFFYTNFLVEIK